MGIFDRVKRGWNAFFNKDPTDPYPYDDPGHGVPFIDYGAGYASMPYRVPLRRDTEKSIFAAVYTRIAVDAAQIDIMHAKLDEEGRFESQINSKLNNCLTLEANIDQTSRALMLEAVVNMLDTGQVAIVPVDTTSDPTKSSSFDIETMRVGMVKEWYSYNVKVEVYNEATSKREEVILPKSMVAIIQNPFYEIMNEPNSTGQRLKRKLALLDVTDQKSASSKLNMVLQLPYVVKTKIQEMHAEKRVKSIEDQLSNSNLGIAYTDGTEHVIQLNRSLENNLQAEIEYLTNMFYSQLSITPEILNGTANEATMQNYYNRTVEPILDAITLEFRRKFLSKTARSQRQSIVYFRNPFKLIPASQIAEIADKMTRNEIMTSNEIRQVIGLLPSKDPEADELRNKNLNKSTEQIEADKNNQQPLLENLKEDEGQNG